MASLKFFFRGKHMGSVHAYYFYIIFILNNPQYSNFVKTFQGCERQVKPDVLRKHGKNHILHIPINRDVFFVEKLENAENSN